MNDDGSDNQVGDELAARLRRAVEGIDGAGVTRASIDARLADEARASRRRRALVAAAAALLVLGGGVAIARAGDDGPTHVASDGPEGSTTTTDGADGGARARCRSDERRSIEAYERTPTVRVGGRSVRPAPGSSWGLDVDDGSVRSVAGSSVVPVDGSQGRPLLLVLTRVQVQVLLDDGLLEATMPPPPDTLAATLTMEQALDLEARSVGILPAQLEFARYVPDDGEAPFPSLATVPVYRAPGSACDPSDTAAPAPSTTERSADATTTLPPATTTTEVVATTAGSDRPVELSTATEGGAAWVVYVAAYRQGADHPGEGAPTPDLARYGYVGHANPLACDVGGAAVFPFTEPSTPADQAWVIGVYFATEADATAFLAGYPGDAWGPQAVTTTCVDQPDPVTGQHRSPV